MQCLSSQEGLCSLRSLHLFKLKVKRIFDICFASSALLAGAPLFLGLMLILYVTQGAPIFYSQTRIGRYGRPFRLWKFRSMARDADEQLSQILEKSPSMLKEWGASQKLRSDPRITPLGRWLRSSSLDELPQFWNVLMGELSVVGPRPLTRAEVEMHMCEHAVEILGVRPGLTGLWQTSGRNDISMQERIEMDLLYARQWTLIHDLRLILRTVPLMVSSRGAY